MRRAAKVDDNQKDIVLAFRRLGYSVYPTHALGGGFPDLVTGRDGLNYLVEVKDGKKPPSARKLTEKEAEFFDDWRGQRCIIESIEQVFAFHDNHMRQLMPNHL